MTQLLLRRHKPLDPRELARLPGGCVGVQGDGDVIAKANVNLPLERLLDMVFRMGQAIPDGRLDVLEASAKPAKVHPRSGSGSGAGRPVSAPPRPASSGPVSSPAPPTGVKPPPVDPEALARDPWALVKAGRAEEAEALFKGGTLTSNDRDEVRNLLRSTDPVHAALGCRIAGETGWRSSVQLMRRLVQHADTQVRLDATTAIGKLAGPGMVTVLRPLLTDPSEDVQAAAQAAIRILDGEVEPPAAAPAE